MWTADALRSEAHPYAGSVWRLVESQSQIATVRITDTLDEQARLEALLDRTKPTWPVKCEGMDFLLATPFRYWPYPNGSRFRRAQQQDGVFYAAETVKTAVAEMSFYRLMFFMESPEMRRSASAMEMSAFSVDVRTDIAVDLTQLPFSEKADWWQNATDYSKCQDLSDQARMIGAGAIRYRSVRCPDQGINLAILDPDVFVDRLIKQRQTWHILVRQGSVQALCESQNERIEFDISSWAKTDSRVMLD